MSDADYGTQQRDEEFAARAKAVLDRGTTTLDARIVSRLTQARHAALERSPHRARLDWWPAAAAATVAAVAVLVWSSAERVPETALAALQAPTAVDDFEIVLAGESLELYEELDFYEWLDAQTDRG